ncbi:unannotated protein [freshwater metagenome]|uniref:Unannotated protein n=1 Tax=freshwater metagenome TaxID=449393 RepID=A0A6J7GNV5_9ZZZZ
MLTLPAGGVVKPEMPIVPVAPEPMDRRPSKTVRLRAGWLVLRYATTSDQPASLSAPVAAWTSATV